MVYFSKYHERPQEENFVKITLRELSEEAVAKIQDELITNLDPVVIVYVDNHGGDPLLACSLYSMLRQSGKKVITYAMCRVYSAAMIVYLAGHIRYAHEFSHFMIHEVSLETDGEETVRAKNLKKDHDDLVRDTENLFQLIARESTLKVRYIKTKLRAHPDWFFFGSEALENSIVHKLGFPRNEADSISAAVGESAAK